MTRAEYVAALLARIQTLTLPAGTEVEEHPGDEYELNDEAAANHIGVLYASGRGAPLLEAGGPVTFRPTYGFEVHVSTHTHADGMAMLEALEVGLHGHVLQSPFWLEWVSEELEVAFHGLYKWVQVYRISPLISR